MSDVVIAHYRIERELKLFKRYQLFAITIEIVIIVALLIRIVFVANKHFFIMFLGPHPLIALNHILERDVVLGLGVGDVAQMCPEQVVAVETYL